VEDQSTSAHIVPSVALAQGAALPSETEACIFVHGVFGTGSIIDTFTLTAEQYQAFAERARDALAKRMPDVEWKREQAARQDEFDSLPEIYPVLNLSFLMALSPRLLASPQISFPGPAGAPLTLELSEPVVYFHAFSGGVVSLVATPVHGNEWTIDVWRAAEHELMRALSPLVSKELARLVTAFNESLVTARVPVYTTPFLHEAGLTDEHKQLDWGHRIFVAHTRRAEAVETAAAFLAPLMHPIDDRGVGNMSLSPQRFLYLGSGRSLIAYASDPRSPDADERIFRSYVRMVEVRQYVWRILYHLDWTMRNAVVRTTTASTNPRAARDLVAALHSLDSRVTGVLDELDPYKLTFDSESVWLMKQLDANWRTADLVESLRTRLASLSRAYEKNEENVTREREARLRAVLNLIGFVATVGSVAQVIGYFDPQNSLPVEPERAMLLVGSVALIILVFLILLAVNVRRR
jgi:hypothetical protein